MATQPKTTIVPLPQLVQQLREVLTECEYSNTPSEHTTLRSTLRSLLVKLLDFGASSQRANSRELSLRLQLIKLPLEKVPHWLSGQGNGMLLSILEKMMPLLVHPGLERKAREDLVDSISLILLQVAETELGQFESLVGRFCDLFLGRFDMYSFVFIHIPRNSYILWVYIHTFMPIIQLTPTAMVLPLQCRWLHRGSRFIRRPNKHSYHSMPHIVL